MSLPVEPDYVVVQAKVGASYVILCGIENATVNNTANTTDRFRRNCQAPAAIPERNPRVDSVQWDVTGSGVINMDQIETYQGLLGARTPFRLLYGQFDDALTNGERTGDIFGYRDGTGVMTAYNETLGEEGTAEITIAGVGALTWTVGTPA